jgi:hypothetical protein
VVRHSREAGKDVSGGVEAGRRFEGAVDDAGRADAIERL